MGAGYSTHLASLRDLNSAPGHATDLNSPPSSVKLPSAPVIRSYQAASLGGGLNPVQQNGKSIWGTTEAPSLSEFLTNNPLPNGKPWGSLDAKTNYYETFPNTGVIRSYDFTISRGSISPDGYQRDVLLVNGAFPGPLIEANWGDTIQVTVHNNITGPEEGTALHWHGFLQQGTPWQDGVPAVTQCPIAPGKSFTYSFNAELYGSTWYHSHYSAQYAGGLMGPLVVHGPRILESKYDVDVGPVLLSDWYHEDYFRLVQRTMASNGTGPFASDSNLINGKMNYDCSQKDPNDPNPCVNNAGVSKFKFKRGKIHRLRVMNVGAEGLQKFAIDGHKMQVIANDFVSVMPYETDVLTLGIGQRADILVKANGDGDSFWMRSFIPSPCGISTNPNAQAAVFYDGADESKEPTTVASNSLYDHSCVNDDLDKTKPILPIPVFPPDSKINIDVGSKINESGVALWTMDGVDFRGNYNSPTLLMSNLNNHTFEEQWNVKNTGNASIVRVLLNNTTPGAHPMHLHGFNMQILAAGEGEWDGKIKAAFNPPRRDVAIVPASGYLVMQFNASSNPGLWPFHCHIAWHVSAGMMVQFLTNPNAVAKMKIPKTVAETCREWGTWTNTNIPDQIDSGL